MPSTSIWNRPQLAGRGRAPEHTRGEIARAAVAVADREGLSGVTMRAVAQTVGAGAASLYRYVATRDELLELMVDEVNGEFELSRPLEGSWLEQMLELAHQARGIYRRHPWMIEALDTTPTLGPQGCRYLENCLAVLSSTAATGREQLEAVAVFGGLVRLLAKAEQDQEIGSGTEPLPQVVARHARLSAVAADGDHPHLAEALAEADSKGAGSAHEDQSDRILRRVLTGLVATPAG